MIARKDSLKSKRRLAAAVISSPKRVHHVPSCHVIPTNSAPELKAGILFSNSGQPLRRWGVGVSISQRRLFIPSFNLSLLPIVNSKSQHQMADSNNAAQPGNHPPKAPPVLDPPKDDPISAAQLAECDGTLVPHVFPSALTSKTNPRAIKQHTLLLASEI